MLLTKDNMQTTKPIVLILCTGNSCRSHLAEGFLRAAAGDILDVQSAGSKPAGYVHPMAIKVMQEVGIDISQHTSKHLSQFLDQKIETVITVCGNADQACPISRSGEPLPLGILRPREGRRQRRGNSENVPASAG